MSYCMFQNTLKDLRDCVDELDHTDIASLSDDEQLAAHKIIMLSKRIWEDFGNPDDN